MGDSEPPIVSMRSHPIPANHAISVIAPATYLGIQGSLASAIPSTMPAGDEHPLQAVTSSMKSSGRRDAEPEVSVELEA